MINRTVMVIDSGLFISLAQRLTREFKRVLYFKPWVRSDPSINDIAVGKGYDFEVIGSVEDHEDETDVFCFCYLYTGALQDRLRRQGRSVWGPGSGGEGMELYRAEMKGLMKEVGLPVNPYEEIRGMAKLREYLKAHDDKWVKVSFIRGLRETWKHDTYALSKCTLDVLEADLGGMSETQRFIVEDPIKDAVETGYDGFCIDGQFPKLSLYGVEVKDCGYVQKVSSKIPDVVSTVNEKLSPYMKQVKYRGFFFTEIRNDTLIDVTARMASPAGETTQELWSNLGEIINAGADGKLVEPIPTGKYAAQAMIRSEWADKNWLAVQIPKEIRQWFKLYNSTIIKGVEYVVPTWPEYKEVGSVLAIGDTVEEAIAKCKEYADQIKGMDIRVKTEALSEAKEELEKVET